MARGENATGRLHKATYATDKRKGGYLIRVIGPTANAFVGRDVPVTRRDDTESMEHLERLIWSGIDTETGQNVALYAFVARPREEDREEIAF